MQGGGAIRGIVAAVIVGGGLVGFAFRDQLTGAASELQVGDCFEEPATMTDVNDVQHRPCNEPHTGEVIAVFDFPNPGAAYPGTEAFDDVVKTECVDDAFVAYTGFAFDAQEAAAIDLGFFYPQEQNWGSDKEIICYVRPLDDQPVAISWRAG